jgi:hypothetical protein
MLKLYINQNFDAREVSVWLVDEQQGMDVFYTTHPEDPNFQGITRHASDQYIRTGEDPIGKVKPFMKIGDRLFNEFVRLMVDYASKNNTVKTENENLIQGKLLATEKHLEDLRIIVFKTLKIEQK